MHTHRARVAARSGVAAGALALIAMATVGIGQSAAAGTPAALWHMDETTGSTMVDASGNGNDGRLSGVAIGQEGAAGTGYGFFTTPAIVSVPDSVSLDPGSAAITVSAQLKMDAVPSASVGDFDVIRKGLAGTKGGDWKMEVLDNGYLFCRFRGSGGAVTWRHSPNLADNAWHQVSCTRDGNQLILTVDGTSWTKTASTGSIANDQPVLVGSQSRTGVDQYSGLMDEVTISIG